MKDIQGNITLIIVVFFWIFFIWACVLWIQDNQKNHGECIEKYWKYECEQRENKNNQESEYSIKSYENLPPR